MILKHLPQKMIEENEKKKLNAMLNWIILNTSVIIINQFFDKAPFEFKVMDWAISSSVVISIIFAKCKNIKVTYLAFALYQSRIYCKLF